jgi:hypothetical protein
LTDSRQNFIYKRIAILSGFSPTIHLDAKTGLLNSSQLQKCPWPFDLNFPWQKNTWLVVVEYL